MDPESPLPQIIITVIIVSIILFIGLSMGQAALDATENPVEEKEGQLLDGTNWVEIDDRTATGDEVVYNSRGYGLKLTGADDSYYQSEENIQFATDANWTIATWAAVDNTSADMAALSANGEVVIRYVGSSGNWSAWIYDSGARQAYQVNKSATDPQNLTNVMVWENETHVAIYEDNTVGEVKAISDAESADAPVNTTNWNGTLDEVRAFDDALNNSQRQQVVDDPVGPLKASNRTMRVMFDEPYRDTQQLFFASGDIIVNNGQFVDGLDGQKMDGQGFWNDITGETDYQWDPNGPRIRAVEGGDLDGAPVAYVDWTATGRLSTSIVDDWAEAMVLAGLIPVLLILGYVVVQLQGLRGGKGGGGFGGFGGMR